MMGLPNLGGCRVNLGSVNQSLILAGESREVDILVTRATQVSRGTADALLPLSVPERREQGVALQSQTVDTPMSYASLQDLSAGRPGRSPVDLYRRVQTS